MPSWRTLIAPVLPALLCFVLAVVMIEHLSFKGNLASVWPANAVILAQLLGRPRREWGRYLSSAFVAIAAAGIVARGTLGGPIAFACANSLEIVLAGWLLRGSIDRDGRLLHRHASVGRFVLCAGVIAPVCGATLSALIAGFVFHLPIGVSLATKFSADALGLLIFTPFFFGLFHGDYLTSLRTASWQDRLQRLGLYGTVLAVGLLVFGQNRYPLLFMPLVPLMLVAFRLGWQGTSLGVLIVAVIGGVATFHGTGPIHVAVSDMGVQMAFLQVYLATVLMLMMPVAAALAARRDLIERLSESERALKLLADRSAIVLVRFAHDGVCTRMVGDAAALVGEDAQNLLGAHVGELGEPFGGPLFAAHLRAVGGDLPVTIEVQRAGGAWIEATFRAERDEHGGPAGTVATLVDVTAHKRREGELARRAETDDLTGLVNRAGFLRRFDAALTATGDLSVALIDVDRFKSLNDEFGHVAGDAALAEIGRRIASSVRAGDVVARLGGDEFVVLLHKADRLAAMALCERIVRSVSSAPIGLPLGGEVEARISCGLVNHTPGQSGIDLLNRADLALYEAKRNGRNQLIAA